MSAALDLHRDAAQEALYSLVSSMCIALDATDVLTAGRLSVGPGRRDPLTFAVLDWRNSQIEHYDNAYDASWQFIKLAGIEDAIDAVARWKRRNGKDVVDAG